MKIIILNVTKTCIHVLRNIFASCMQSKFAWWQRVRRIKRYQQFETIINCTLSDYQKINEIIILQNRVERNKNVTYQMSRRGWPCVPCWYSQGFPRVGVAVEVAAAWCSPCPCCSLNFDVSHNATLVLTQRKHISRNMRVDDPLVRRKTYVYL